ncbi:hypothetical protein DM860_009884 [Cuscuta australis]|uniref:RING-type domain-containing protein n=1 Tax=Cuscuta australis TaxID=267555 RepID=A0A328DB81_9ASTE|nr:hypothetical protein DM860_009884 [Cuscuta australis]
MAAAPRSGGYMGGWVYEDPRHGQLSIRLITKALAISGGFSCTLGDHTFTLPFDPLRLVLAGKRLRLFLRRARRRRRPRMCRGARRPDGPVRPRERHGRGLCPVRDIPVGGLGDGPPPGAGGGAEAAASWGPAVGPGLSEDEVAALEKQRFAGEEEEAPSCAVCLEEYREGDVITPLSSSCSHYFHNACIAKWLRRKKTCPVCRAPVTGGRQS